MTFVPVRTCPPPRVPEATAVTVNTVVAIEPVTTAAVVAETVAVPVAVYCKPLVVIVGAENVPVKVPVAYPSPGFNEVL